jgi:hypothetical protein
MGPTIFLQTPTESGAEAEAEIATAVAFVSATNM